MSNPRISIPGGNGRMGKTLIKEILNNGKLSLSNSTCLTGEPELGIDLGILAGKNKIDRFLTDDKSSIVENTDVIIDFTVPEASLFHAKIASEHRIPIVIGTTGLNENQLTELRDIGKLIPIVYSANFSIGIALMQDLVEDSVKKLGLDWDIEILESHHNQKVDAPSGTALLIGNVAAEARKQKLHEVMSVSRNGIIGKRNKDEIGFAVIRGGDIVGEHSIKFFNQSERIEINHLANNRNIFAKGAIRSAIWAIDNEPGFYSLKDVLKIN